MSRRQSAMLSLLFVVLFAVAMHWPVFLAGKTVSAFDFAYFSMGAYRDARPEGLEQASNGLLSDPVVMYQVWDQVRYKGLVRFPWLWDPYAGCGSPLLANAESTPLFPLKTLAYAFVGPARGFGLLCFFRMLLAGVFMWAYLRRVGAGYAARTMAAVAFMASGFMIAWLQWAHTNVALTFPLLLLGCEHLVDREFRHGFLLVGIAVALGLLGGHPETSLHATFAAAVYTGVRLIFRRRVTDNSAAMPVRARFAAFGVLCAAGVVGAVIAAVQIVPMVEYIGLSARLAKRSTQATARRASVLAHPNARYARREFLSYLLPNAYGNPSRHSHWWKKGSNFNESAGYVGVGMALMGLLAWRWCRRDRTVLALCILQLISLGFVFNVPQVTATLGRLPLLDIAANKRFLLVWCFSTAALGALAVDKLVRAERFDRVGMVWLSVLGALFVSLVAYDFSMRFAGHPVAWIRADGRAQIVHFAVFFLPWFVVPFLVRFPERARAAAAAALSVLLAVDLYLVHFGYNPFIEPGWLYPSTPAIEYLQSRDPPVRVLPIGTQIGPNMPAVYGLQDARLYDAQVYGPYDQLLKRLGAHGGWNIVSEPDATLCAVAGIRYLWSDPDWTPEKEAQFDVCYEDDTSVVYENTRALPLAYVSRAWRAAGSPGEAYDALTSDEFPWQRCVVVETGGIQIPQSLSLDETPHEPVEIVEHAPRRVALRLDGETAGLLVLSDCHYPGWRALVDGERRPIYRANGTFRGVFIKPSDRQVVFLYRPASFRWGAILSVAGLVVFVVVVTPLRRMLAGAFRQAGRRRRDRWRHP